MKLGQPITMRMTAKTESLFKQKAKQMDLPIGVYCRMFIEDMLKKYNQVPKKVYEPASSK
jgi:hypothetical protein